MDAHYSWYIHTFKPPTSGLYPPLGLTRPSTVAQNLIPLPLEMLVHDL